MLKLYAVVLGGRADGCNIELHDVVFVVGNTLEDTYPTLIQKWFGNKKRMHIDSSIELTHADHHDIVLSHEKISQELKLFFVNFGAYKAQHFGEIHQTAFYVGKTKTEVLARAKKDLCVSLDESHCDDNLIVDDIMAIESIDGLFLQLVPSSKQTELTIINGYRKLIAA
jgi:hypothetical protein